MSAVGAAPTTSPPKAPVVTTQTTVTDQKKAPAGSVIKRTRPPGAIAPSPLLNTSNSNGSNGGLPLPVLLGGAGGLAALAVGLGSFLLLRPRRKSKRGSGSAQAGPCAKLKPTSRCVPLADGSACVIRREIAADNSCLFNSVGYAMHKSRTRAPHLRTVVAQQVASDRTTYSDAFLGMTNEAYCNWIRQPYNWGGGIELSILAQAYGMEITAWNIETCKNHVFGEESGYKRQVMVIYNGVHYDALAVCAGPRANPEDDETSYNPRTKRGKMIVAAARKLVELAHKESQFQGATKKQAPATSTTTSASATSAPAKSTRAAEAAAPKSNGPSSVSDEVAAAAKPADDETGPPGPRKAGSTVVPATRRVARGAAAATGAVAVAASTTTTNSPASNPGEATTAAYSDPSGTDGIAAASASAGESLSYTEDKEAATGGSGAAPAV